MGKKLRLGEFLLAVEGLALARNLYRGSDEHTKLRLREMQEILDALDHPDSFENLAVDTNEVGSLDGYQQWSEIYDEIENPLIAFEQPILESVLKRLSPGKAIDFCTGTGRVASMLHRFGHEVVGIDQSPSMLALAQAKVPGATFRCAELSAPESDFAEAFTVATCALALTHFMDLSTAVSTIAQYICDNGHVVITDVHPFFTFLDAQAFFNADEGRTPWVRNHNHLFSDYLDAFSAAGLEVISCLEPALTEGDGPLQGPVSMLRPDAARTAFLGTPYVVVWVLQKRAA